MPDLPHIDRSLFSTPELPNHAAVSHPLRILLLYGSVRERSYSRLASEEAARLLQCETADIQADRVGSALRLARHFDAVVALKGCGTVLARPDGRWRINTLGNSGLATGGTGDVLAGLIGALLAQGWPAWEAA